MFIRLFTGGPMRANGYFLYDQDGGTAAVIDCPLGSTRYYLEALRVHRASLVVILNTHGHWDHIADNAPFSRATGAPIWAHGWDMTRLAHPGLELTEELKIKVEPSRADKFIGDGAHVEIGSIDLEVLHTPGHCPGSICLFNRASGVLFSGDTLMRAGVGRTDLPGGNARQLRESLLRLGTLPDNTRIYPGHGIPSTIGEERWLIELAIEV